VPETTLPPLTGSAVLDPWRARLRHVHDCGELPRRRGPLPETRSEALLREALARRPEGWAAEHATGRYRLDFSCAELAMALEVDGASHWGHESAAADAARDAWHAARGIVTHRLSAREVETDLAGVMRQVDWWVALRRRAAPAQVAPQPEPALLAPHPGEEPVEEPVDEDADPRSVRDWLSAFWQRLRGAA